MPYSLDFKKYSTAIKALSLNITDVSEMLAFERIPKMIEIILEYTAFIKALNDCKIIAKEELKFVSEEMRQINELDAQAEAIRTRFAAITTSKNATSDEMEAEVSRSLEELSQNFFYLFQETLRKLTADIAVIGEDWQDFKIVIFGRTKAGKSTVREALTSGNGETIGRGGQSFTVETNEYKWHNLKVFDTPGILSSCATGDAERKKAEVALEKADVVIFILANDNISEAELKYMNDISRKDKDLLVLLNVKRDIANYSAFKKRYAKEISLTEQAGHLERINRDCSKPPTVIPIHAQAAFFSRGNGEKVDEFTNIHGNVREELYAISNFGKIRTHLINNILTNGKSIRCRTIREHFIQTIDAVVKKSEEKITSAKNCIDEQLKNFRKTHKEILGKKKRHYDGLEIRLLSLAEDEIDTHEVAYSCINNGKSKDAIISTWENEILKLNKIPSIIFSEIGSDLQKSLDELVTRLEFSSSFSDKMEDIDVSWDWKSTFKYGAILTGAITTGIALIWNPAGWVLIALGVLGTAFSLLAGIFKSTETKINELQEKFDDSLNQIVKEQTEKIKDYCNKELFGKIIKGLDDGIKRSTQRQEIINEYRDLNDKLKKYHSKNQKLLIKRLKELSTER